MRFTKLITAASILSLAAVPVITLALNDHGASDCPSCGKHGADHAATAAATVQQAGQAIEISVTGDGFVPANIQVKKGQPVKLIVTRKTERTCATEIVIKDMGINQPLPLNKPVVVQFTPVKSGQLRYACGMDMISGVIVVQ
jgi:plastocyanin domain-containing protein